MKTTLIGNDFGDLSGSGSSFYSLADCPVRWRSLFINNSVNVRCHTLLAKGSGAS
ncbi:MAG: hypothetical protein ACXW09_11025 [Methylococcaceae bacterium]